MTEIIYDLFITLSFSIGGFSLFAKIVFEKTYDLKGLLMFFAISAYLVVIKNIKAKSRLLVGGITVFVLALIYFFFSRGLIFTKMTVGLELILEIAVFTAFAALSLVATKFKGVRIAFAIGLVLALIIQMFFEINPEPFAFSLCIIYVIMIFSEMLNSGIGKADYKKYIVYLWPFLLVFFLVLSGIKPPAEPYDWKGFVNMYERASEFVRELSDRLFENNEEEYSISTIDFSDESGFGKNRKGMERRLMEIKSNMYSGDYIFLSGSHFESFDGHEWTQTSGIEERAFEALEVMNAAKRNSETKVIRDYCAVRTVDVRFLTFTTQFTFVPEKPISFTMDESLNPVVFNNGSMLFNEKKGIDTEYKVSFINENRNTEAVVGVLKSGIPFSREILESDVSNFFKGYEDRFSYDNYIKYKKNVYEKYLDKGEYSERVNDFIKDIYEGADNDFERLLLLEKKLRNYEYTLSPREIPSSVKSKEDYLDFWLFESGEGYCTHFATAFTLMAREMGIPTRYVQGYRAEVKEVEATVVKNNNAHAYAEAYIDGFGFVSFEPTPGYRLYSTWSVSKPNTGLNAGSSDSVSRPAGSNDTILQTDESPAKDEVSEEVVIKKHVNLMVFVMIFGVIVWFLAIFFLVSFLHSLRRIKKLEGQAKTYALCRICMRILNYIGCQKSKEETLSEFYLSQKDNISGTCLAFIDVYERLLYGQDAISEKDFETVNEAYGRLLICLKEEKKILYPVYLYLCLGE